ncbi:MAG: hypothetical protein KIT54_04675 [Phycisphaeraceae bacterium]|nr:hypothetical protein [Phycisphaeraceae bacterium]
MPWRTIRRCLLFAFLGLLTSVVVAWGVVVHVKLRPQGMSHMRTGVAVVDGVIQRVYRHRRFGQSVERWEFRDTAILTFNAEAGRQMAREIESVGGAANDEGTWALAAAQSPPTPMPTIIGRLDDLAAQGPPVPVHNIADVRTSLTLDAVGWPMRALYSTRRWDSFAATFDANGKPTGMGNREEISNAFVIRWPARAGQSMPDTLVLPYMPRPGLALNTAFFGMLWALVLLAPGAIRRRRRIARGCCAACGFSLAGQTRPGCSECGDGRRAAAR